MALDEAITNFNSINWRNATRLETADVQKYENTLPGSLTFGFQNKSCKHVSAFFYEHL